MSLYPVVPYLPLIVPYLPPPADVPTVDSDCPVTFASLYGPPTDDRGTPTVKAKWKTAKEDTSKIYWCMPQWSTCHDDVIKWRHFPRYWPFVRGIQRPPVNSPHKGHLSLDQHVDGPSQDVKAIFFKKFLGIFERFFYWMISYMSASVYIMAWSQKGAML